MTISIEIYNEAPGPESDPEPVYFSLGETVTEALEGIHADILENPDDGAVLQLPPVFVDLEGFIAWVFQYGLGFAICDAQMKDEEVQEEDEPTTPSTPTTLH
jgi:hypothetical protein